MRKYTVNFAAMAALSLVAAQARAVIINIEAASAGPGSTVPIAVDLNSEGASVAGTQNDIGFTAPLKIQQKSNHKPNCAVNDAINKGGTSFAFQPPACTPDTDCSGVRALVLALDNVDPITDGAILYTCQLDVASDAAAGDFTLTNSNEGASDPEGNALTTTGTDGTVTVQGQPAGTIRIGSVTGNAGDFVTFSTSLDVVGENQIAGTQNDTTFDPLAPIAATGTGKPMCVVNEAINKGGTSFAFQPPACTVGTSCTGVRALVLALDNVDPIPSGSTMYSCQVAISETATEGDYPLTCSNAGASDPQGNALPVDCTNGKVSVVVVPTATATPTNTVQIGTPTATSTNTRSATPTRSVGPNDADDGCAIVSPAQSQAGWMLLLPAAMLIWLRRRSR